MLIRYLMICACLSFVLTSIAEPADSSVEPFVQSAKAVLTGQDSSNSDIEVLAGDLLRAADSNPNHPLYAQAVFLTQLLLDSLELCQSEEELCHRLVANAPESPFTMRSFEMVWNHLTDQNTTPVSGSEFALDMAIAAKGELSAKLFNRGFQPYIDAGMWNTASEAGMRYLHGIETVYDPSIYLDIADAELKAGNSNQSIELLQDLVAGYPKHPAMIRGCTELGLIQLALGSIEEANTQFIQAWSAFQKFHKKPGYEANDIVHSAARALWEYQEYNFSALKRKFADRISTNNKTVRADQKHLEDGYNLVLETDPSFTAQSWTRIGDLHLAFAEAYLREGYESIQVAGKSDLGNPYDRSLEYFQRAQVAYHNAMFDEEFDSEPHPQHWSESTVDWNRMAIHNRYDVFDREAEVVYSWAMDIWEHAPERGLGEEGLSKRYDLLVKRVVPLVIESLNYRQTAFDAASENPSEFQLTDRWNSLDKEMWTSLNLVTDLCRSEWNTTSATAIQLSKTLQITGNPAAVSTFRETLANQLNLSKTYWEEGQIAISELYQAYLDCRPRQEPRDNWDRELMNFHQQFAELAGSSSSQLESSTSNLDPLDPVAQTLKQRLRTIASDAAKAERLALSTAVDMASEFGINNEEFSDIYGRLREIDPAQYPTLEVYRASRK
jgi:tetratricopeptide (TPR) repeat protein